MKHSSFNDLSAKLKFLPKELKLKPTQFIRSNSFLPLKYRAYAAFSFYFSKSFSVRLHNYCILTGRSRAVVRDFKVSRMVFKRLASFGLLHGVTKGSW